MPGQVLENLFIGGVGCAFNLESLQQVGITHIMTVATDCKPRFENKFTYKVISAFDTPNYNIA